jgi:RHS repeat-associated protein
MLTRRYDAWGNLESGTTGGYAFTGREHDPETGLAYYRARYYDPQGGRFTSTDPLGFAAGTNFYEYVDNAPSSQTDPFGLLPLIPGVMPSCEDALIQVATLGGMVLTGQFPGRNQDKRAHCLAHCIIRKGCGANTGLGFTLVIGYGKEALDAVVGAIARKTKMGPPMVRRQKWDPDDINANWHGFACSPQRDCESNCADAPSLF